MASYTRFYTACLIIILTLSGCAQIVVQKVDYAPSAQIPQDAHPAPIKFSGLKFLLPPGTDIGMESGMGPMLFGGFCSWGQTPINRRVLSRKFQMKWLEASFEEALETQGYDVTNQIDMDFEYEDELGRAEYFISAKVVDVDLDLCKRSPSPLTIFNSAQGAKGKINVTFDWTVYDALRRTVVYETRTQGYSRRDYPNQEGYEILFMDAFDMAAHNLGAEKTFYNLIVEGKKPAHIDKARYNSKSRAPRPSQFDPLEPVTILNPPLRDKPFTQVAEDKRKNAVTIQKYGHGSGFFISKQGHILTNAHVVGNSQRTRIVLADKKQAITAEVLRINKARDVALLKLSELPDNYEIELLPIRAEQPKVSTPVYAIGTPKHRDTLDNTITKGIISNHREYKWDGLTLNYIQADVDIHGGNSGGPLLDEYGNIIGISVAGLYMDEAKRGIGLNLFIPIKEALEVLDIGLE